MKEMIKELVSAYGPSGNEGQVRAIIESLAVKATDDIRTDSMGNLIVLKKGTGGGKRVMVAAHMDEIGLVVSYIDKNGFARVNPVGGVRIPSIMGTLARFADGTVATINREKAMTKGNEVATWDEIFLDFGVDSAEDCPVGIGDMACLDCAYADLGKRLVGKAMDDRISCAVELQALLEMGESPNDIYFVFTVQEEVGTRGAMVSAFGVEPDLGIAIDVTLSGDTPEDDPFAVVLGKGPAIKVMDSGSIAHPGVKNWMIKGAQEMELPYQLEVLKFGGTDARAIQMSRGGVPSGCISVPTRYVHTSVEMVDMDDVENSVKLLKGLLSKPIAF